MQEVFILSIIGICGCDAAKATKLRAALTHTVGNKAGLKYVEEGGVYDAILIGKPPKSHNEFKTDILIVPNSVDTSRLSPILASFVVSYGMNRENTVTASSISPSKLSVSVQRRIPTVNGSFVDEQEIIINSNSGRMMDEILGEVATLLAAGAEPKSLSEISF